MRRWRPGEDKPAVAKAPAVKIRKDYTRVDPARVVALRRAPERYTWDEIAVMAGYSRAACVKAWRAWVASAR